MHKRDQQRFRTVASSAADCPRELIARLEITYASLHGTYPWKTLSQFACFFRHRTRRSVESRGRSEQGRARVSQRYKLGDVRVRPEFNYRPLRHGMLVARIGLKLCPVRDIRSVSARAVQARFRPRWRSLVEVPPLFPREGGAAI
jgi:hypothetical protein